MTDGANFQIPKTSLDDILRPNLNSFQRNRSENVIVGWDHVFSNRLLLQTAFYQKWSKSRLLPNADPLGAKADAERTVHTYGLKSDVTRYVGRHVIKSGVDAVLLQPDEKFSYLSQPWIDYTHIIGADHIHFRGPDRVPVVFAQERTGGQVSAYVQDKFKATPRLTADVGLRYDNYNLAVSGFRFSPRINVAYDLTRRTVLHGSYNHFFVPPPIENVLMNSAGLTRLISEIGSALPPLQPINEDQFELGMTRRFGELLRAGVTGYYRKSDDPVHTVVFPDVRVYGYANFDRGKAYGMELKLELPMTRTAGVSGYLNYALGRVWFYNPVIAGFTTEAAHLNERNRFLAPMDQTHTLTSGISYRHARSRLWTSLMFEYGSGTPIGHGGADHAHEASEAEHSHGAAGIAGNRVPGHFTQNLTIGWDATGDPQGISLQFNVENLSNRVYVVARESAFTPGQYSMPRQFSGSMKVRF
jgi:outer membrane receptor protein involved in Fe transport